MMAADAVRCMHRTSTPAPSGDSIPWSTTATANLVTFSEDDFVVTSNSSVRRNGSMDTAAAKSGGAHYAEVLIEAISTTVAALRVGIAPTNVSRYSNIGDNADTFSYRCDGAKFFEGAFSAGYAAYAAGDSVGVGVDFDNETIEFFKNGVSNGVESVVFDAAAAYTLCWSAYYANDSFRIVTNPAAMAHPVPAGYAAWSFN